DGIRDFHVTGVQTCALPIWPFSGEIVFMTVLGGFHTFAGPILGAVAFNYLKVYAVASSHYWQLVLGVVLVIMVMLLPAGIVGTRSEERRVGKECRSRWSGES